MSGPFVNKGKDVFLDPTMPTDGPAVMHPGMVSPTEQRPTINGAPVDDEAHRLVVKKGKNALNR